MNNQQAVIEQIIQNLAFEVEAVPKNKSIQATSISQNTPMDVKIRVRKKDEIHMEHDVSSITDETARAMQKIRLVTSDQTIMTFDVFMEAEFKKESSRSLRKHVFDLLKPGVCLGDVDDDNYPYLPSFSYSANVTKSSKANRSDGTFKQTFTLSKNLYQDYTVLTQPGEQKWLFGKCKPGGCLDPPFSEDKYSYKPSTRSEPERIEPERNVTNKEELHEEDDVKFDIKSNRRPITLHDEEAKSNKRHSSIFDGGLFKKKRRSTRSDKSTNTKLSDKTDSLLNLYQVESLRSNSVSTHSNSIITYPPKILSDISITNDKTARSKSPSEDKSKKSFNDHSVPYFIPPKGVNRIKEENTFNQSNYPKHRSSDVTDLSNSPKESFKIPVAVSIPISIMPKKRKPEVIATNDDILKTQDDNTNFTESDLTPDKELKDTIKEYTEIPPRHLRGESATEDTDDSSVESLKIATSTPSNIEQPATIKIDDTNLDAIKLQPQKEIDSENNIEHTRQPNKTEPLKIPVPVPAPLVLSEPNHDVVVVNDNLQTSDSELTQSNQSSRTKTTPHLTKDVPFEDSKDVNQNIIVPGIKSRESKSTGNETPNSQNSNIEAEPIQKKYLSNKSESIDQESDNENPVTEAPTMEEDIKRVSKGDEITDESEKSVKQNDNKLKDTSTSKYLEEVSDVFEMPNTDIHQIRSSLNKDGRKDSQKISIPNLPVVQKSISLLSGSKISTASVIDEIKRNDIVDKHLYNVGTRYSDISVNRNEISLPNEPKNETDIVNGHTLNTYNDKEYVDEPTKPNNVENIDSYSESQKRFTNDGSMNFITDSVIIDNTELTPNFGEQEVYKKPSSSGHPLFTGFEIDSSGVPLTAQIVSKFDEDDVAHSTVSHELTGTQSAINDMDKNIPSTFSENNNEEISPSDKRIILPVDTGKSSPEIILKSSRIFSESKDSSDDSKNKVINKNNVRRTSVLSSVQSASNLKSAMKKDTISVELGFHSYLNDKNERILQTFNASNALKRFPNDSITVLKSLVRISSNEIRIPVDSEHDLSIQIKKSNTNQRVSISESGFVTLIDNSGAMKQRSPVQCHDAEMRSSEAKEHDNIVESNATNDNVIDFYEQELVPLQLIIKNLRNEIDVLAAQQLMFRNKIFCSNKSKLPRLVHSNKKCFGCVRK